jgi:hypothetical protein
MDMGVTAIPMRMMGAISDDMDTVPRTVCMPVVPMGPYPMNVDQRSPRPIAWAPVKIVVAIPVVRPPIPIVVVVMVDDPDTGWPSLEILNPNTAHIDGVSTRSHEMNFNDPLDYMPVGRNIDGLRSSMSSEDESISTKRGGGFELVSSGLFTVGSLYPQPSCHVIIHCNVPILHRDLEVLGPPRNVEVVNTARNAGLESLLFLCCQSS